MASRQLYAYDAAGRVLSITSSRGSNVIDSRSYDYDAVGSRIQQLATAGQALVTDTASSQVDQDNQLLQRGATTYTYDANGNRLTEAGPQAVTNYESTVETVSRRLHRLGHDFALHVRFHRPADIATDGRRSD